MTRSLIDSDNLATLINECISDLRSGSGRRLYDLAGMIDAIAECQTDSHLNVLPSSIGFFSQQIVASRAMILIPILPKEIREKHTSMINVAVEQGIKALEEIKHQLCDNKEIDYKKLMESAGTLTRHSSKLLSERRSVTPRGGSGSDEE